MGTRRSGRHQPQTKAGPHARRDASCGVRARTLFTCCQPANFLQSEREWRAITAITTLTGRWEAEAAGTHKRKVTGRMGFRLNPNEHTIRCVGAHRAVPDCRQRRSQTCKVQGYAAALAMLDDHESSGPPDGVGSVYEEARYRKKKLGASGHATKDEKDEEQHTQRERESHKRVARHDGGSFSAVRDQGRPGQRKRPSGALQRRQEARRGVNKREPATYGTTPRGTNGRARSMDERVQCGLIFWGCRTSPKTSKNK